MDKKDKILLLILILSLIGYGSYHFYKINNNQANESYNYDNTYSQSTYNSKSGLRYKNDITQNDVKDILNKNKDSVDLSTTLASDWCGYNTYEEKNNISIISFEPFENLEETKYDVKNMWDVSENKDKTAIASIIESQNGYEIKIYCQHGKISTPYNSKDLFAGFQNLAKIKGLENLDTSETRDMDGMFNYCCNLRNINLSSFNTKNVRNMSYMFNQCKSLTSIDVSNFDTSSVKNMKSMFSLCEKLNSIELSNFDTSNVTNMSHMFDGCDSLYDIDVRMLNMSKVEDISHMFSSCDALYEIDLEGWDTSCVTNMSGLFWLSDNLEEIKINTLDTSNVTDMSEMFFGCYNLKKIDLSNIDTSNVEDMSEMFASCGLEKIKVSNFNTENVRDMSKMFFNCKNLTRLDLTNFDIKNVTNMSEMFSHSYDLEEVLVDRKKWDTSGKNTEYLFNMCEVENVKFVN